MAKARLQISLPEDPFYDLKENRSPGRNGGNIMVRTRDLRTSIYLTVSFIGLPVDTEYSLAWVMTQV